MRWCLSAHDLQFRGAMGASTLFCTRVRYFSSQLLLGCAGRLAWRLAPQRYPISVPKSLECMACTMPKMGSATVHLATETISRTVLLVQWAPHASQLRWHLAMRAVRLARHSSMSLPDSDARRCRANLNSLRVVEGGVVDVCGMRARVCVV